MTHPALEEFDDDGEYDPVDILRHIDTPDEALRLIALCKPAENCLHCSEWTLRAKGMWLPGTSQDFCDEDVEPY